MSAVLSTVAPLYVLIALGVLLRLVVADEKWVEVFNKFALYVGFPAIVFSSLQEGTEGTAVGASVVVLNVGLLLFALAATYAAGRALKLSTARRNTYIICVGYGNIAYLGYPFVTSVIPGSGAAASIHIGIYVALLFTVGIAILELSKGKDRRGWLAIVGSMLSSPLLLAVLFGLAARWSGWRAPGFVERGIEMVAASASPLVLLAIGMFMARRIPLDRRLGHAGAITLLKLLALPACFVIALKLWPQGEVGAVSILDAAMPTGITAFALAEAYPLDKEVVATVIVLSTATSMITLPLLASWAI